MKCAWESFIKILPLWMRNKVDELGRNGMQELRLQINAPPELVFRQKSLYLERRVTTEDLQFCVNLATKYSPWSSETVGKGFITIDGGHRIGLCGNMIPRKPQNGFNTITSLCVRIARDFPGIAKDAIVNGSILIIGKPGSGKTTFLRDLVREIASRLGNRIAVVDERYEIFPYAADAFCFDVGKKVDILSGCRKSIGIEMVLRTMTPTTIVVDEITAYADTAALIRTAGCGVSILATAHAAGTDELKTRPIYHTLLQNQIFETCIVLHPDMTWHWERLNYDD